jgi:murein DD-endopeptidase MepM/ murein hydrolase activator NlpD
MGFDTTALFNRLGRIDLSRPRTLAAAGLAAGALAVAAFVAGGITGSSHAQRMTAADLNQWSAELEQQRGEIVQARAAAEQQIAVLAARIGQLQARVIRLDALGKRLTEVAELERGEFDFDAPPAIGGPEESMTGGEFPTVPTVEALLDSLDATLDDRSRQLAALETLILSRELASQIVPGGRPVESGYISSFFGKRPDPFTGETAFHAGIDFAGAPGTRVLAAADGVVSFAGRDKSYGKLVEVTHGNGYVTRYAHNSSLLVEPGQTVRRGDPLALMGSTGRSTGTHLHFEVLRDGRPVNPMSFVRR